MIVKRYYDDGLAQASYLLGCGRTRESIVIDPNRDTDQYVHGAAAEGLRIAHVTETHIHADFASGSRELADRTGAILHLSDEGRDEWKYAYAPHVGAALLHEGDIIRVGEVSVRAIHTPGHTPEHLSFLITDGAAADQPIGIVTGDFVFVGDVGRPDLLEKTGNLTGTMERSARTLYRSLQRFREHPEWMQIWPGHGAGSACGKGLSAVPHSTVGYELRFNWAFNARDEEEFVRMVLAGQPEPPPYFAVMKRLNRDGRPLLDGRPPSRAPAARLDALLSGGAVVVDIRAASDYATAHVTGSINIPLGRSFTGWAGWVLPYDRDIWLVADEGCGSCVGDAWRALRLIGLDRVAGFLEAGEVAQWGRERGLMRDISRVQPAEVAERLDREEVILLDVRAQSEWNAGHVPGAMHVPLDHLLRWMRNRGRDSDIVVHCQTGARSAIAASLLDAEGFSQVQDLAGGFTAWRAAGLPVGTTDS
ncbi:MAG: MBL fold metallo-hydrolase [Gemmatimonadaceae bacterium]